MKGTIQRRSQQSTQVAPSQQASAQETPLESILTEFRTLQYQPVGMLSANFNSAVEALWGNRTRSFLTALGIFIGVAAVIAALTLTQGASASITNQLSSLGTAVIVYPGSSNQKAGSTGQGSGNILTLRDAQSLNGLPHLVAVSPYLMTSDQVIYGSQNWNTQVEGVNTQVETIGNWKLAQGTWFSEDDDAQGTPVAVLGDTTAHSLFDASGTNPIGQQIRIRDQNFRVVGVLAPQGGLGQDDVIFVPFKTMEIRLRNSTTIDQIQAQADSPSSVEQLKQEIETTIRQNHHIKDSSDDSFTVMTFTQVLQSFNQSLSVMTALFVGIAAISLTVGGIGIMNIMLVSVTERTWEIGIRMSIGAKRRDIRNQFLMEALVLCLVGGLIGLILGLLIGWVITYLAKLPFVVTAETLLIPFAVSSAIALVFGIYPAIRASRLDPIVAIRTDA
ncbi:FtsX-like permease family protein [Ktedonosporobacter rubrisoli]|uniref:FtsX-like permease family protein n=1 Tax=Ktedonosporobacter rubrisoli TaxID=2509675 RepID=A0A4P6K1Y4_KTERU|nr:ABC transporter permease [Ktedonosporobacter rubrisoli]QBD81892.1 FtsX-like permease family protein [Ktedonosporobacter rubrisoli]